MNTRKMPRQPLIYVTICLSIFAGLLLVGEGRSEISLLSLRAKSTRVMEGLNVRGDLELYGSRYDGVTLTNSTVTGAVKIDGVQDLVIKNNHLNSIWFRGNDPTNRVTIDHNEISGAQRDCIQLFEGTNPPHEVIIQNNIIRNCGVDFPTSSLYHAIYDQVPGVTIQGNYIADARAAISVRSNALIENNSIEQVTFGGAIEYYSDHDAAPGSELTIKGNSISTMLKDDPGKNRGLIVLGNDIGSGKRAVPFIYVQDNKLAVLNRQEQQGNGKFSDIYVQANAPIIRVESNLLVNLIPNGLFISVPVGVDSGNQKTHDQQALDGIILRPPF
jgi:Right handed beta helix region